MIDPITYRCPRTMTEAFPGERPTAWAIVPADELRGTPSHSTTHQWQDRLQMAASVLCAAVALAIVITTQAPK